MRRISLLSAAALLAVAATAASTPAKAYPFHLIRWMDSGYCEIWNEGIPTRPLWPNYTVVSPTVPTFSEALNVKYNLLAAGTCSF